MYECMQAEARVLILDRTPWHMTWEACDRSAPVVRSTGARVSERVAGGAIPDFLEDEPRGGQPCLRGSRPSSRVSSPLSLSASRLGGTHSTRTVRPTRSCRAPATVAASWFRVRSEDGTTTALHRRPGKEGPAPVPRGTGGLSPSPGLSSYGWKAAPRVEGGATIALTQRPASWPVQYRWSSRRPAPRRPPAAPRRRPMNINY